MPIRKIVSFFLVLIIALSPLFLSVRQASSDQLDQITSQINQLTTEMNQSVAATTPLQSQVTSYKQQVQNIEGQISGVESDIATKKKQINDGYTNLAQEEKIINQTIRNFYVNSYYDDPLLTFFSATSANDITQNLAYQQAETNYDKGIITNLAVTISDLETNKEQLTQEETWLASTKANLDVQTAKLNTIIQGAQAYQQQLSGQIAQLSAEQQQLLAQKYATLGIPSTAYTSNNGCSSDINPYKDPGFSGTKFGFFTYGVPDRVGLNQYGAQGRADAGQSYSQILNAYFTDMQITTMPTSSTTVTVNGTNDYGETFGNQKFDVEDYLKHIYEMPSAWPTQALEAQAIAARSYVMHAIADGETTVAPNQSFQEVKTELNAQPWIDAVNATQGQVMTSGGTPIEAWFSSTFGGYMHSSSDIGWSSTPYTKTAQDTTTTVNSFSDLQNDAYDKSSPWFYCDWGSRAADNNTAWLSSSDVADIINVIMLVQADSSTKEHLYQTDQPNPAGTDTWTASQVQQELHSRGITPYTSVSNITVNADFTNGDVTTVSVQGDAGTQSFDGQFFKTYFDLRAPANIQIVGPLYNVEIR